MRGFPSSLKKVILLALLIVIILGVFSYKSILDNKNGKMTVISITEEGPRKIEPKFKGFKISELFPSRVKTRILRIENRLDHEVLIKNLYVKLDLFKDGKTLDKNNETAKNYLEDMKIQVEFGASNSIDRKKLFEGSFTEFSDGIDCKIPIPKGHSADIFYTILIDDGEGSDFAGIKCNANLTAKVTNIDLEAKSRELAEIIPDINNHWAANCALALVSRGIINGYPDGSIRPDDNITRAEAAVVIAKATGYNPLEQKPQFKDSIPDWAADYIAKLVYEGVFTGYPDGRFCPNEFISRQEATCGIVKALGDGALDDELEFKDAGRIGDWARSWVKTGVDQNIISGYPDNTFRPKENISRAEVFTMICKALGYHEGHEQETQNK